MTTPSEMAIKAADQLLGTSQSIEDLGEDYEDLQLVIEFTDKLDSLIFCCLVCDYWFEPSQMGKEEWVCESCSP